MKTLKIRLTAAAAAVMVTAGSLAVPAFAVSNDSVSTKAEITASSARATRERDSQTGHNVYLLPDSDTYYISESDVSWMDDTELMLARNEFYARRGRKFVTRSIQDYFNRQAWYKGTIEPDQFTPEMFNRYEQANVDFIVAYENRRKQIRQQRASEPAPRNALDSSNPTADENVQEYSELMENYRDALRQGWSEEEIAIAGMNVMVSDLDGPGALGYAYRDLDGDGTAELLIGPTDPQLFGEGAVFEIYTIEDGIPVELASSFEDTLYYICEDNTIRREMIEDDGRWEIDYLVLEEGELICKEVLVMDEELDAESPWFVIDETEELALNDDNGLPTEGIAPDEDYEAISYEDASEIRASYVAGDLGLTPFE